MSARDVLAVMIRTHGGSMTVWSRQEAQGAIDAYRAEVLREAADASAEQEPGTPAPLRWGLDDAELGDDDSVTLWLSGPDREPYVLELEPERATALRELLADAGGCECEPMQLAPDEYMHHLACPTRRGEAEQEPERAADAGRGEAR